MQKHMKQYHYWVHIQWMIFHLAVKHFSFFQYIKCKGSFFLPLNRGEAADTFSATPIKQMLMEDLKTFDVKACSGSSPSPYQLILANWK